MVLIPAGEFWMGSDEKETEAAWELCKKYISGCKYDEFKEEMPKHKVYLDAYYIDKYEVTNAQYKECVKKQKCEKPYHTTFFDNKSFAHHPVVFVDWEQASAYCKWVEKRLPTEAEWEKAARGENENIWSWGNEWDCKKSCNSVSPCIPQSTCSVESYQDDVSPYGVYDMASNVCEWVSDWYDKDYYKNSPYKNPKGPKNGEYRVFRGGSWYRIFPTDLRGASRKRYIWFVRDDDLGFRCAKSAE